MEIIGNPQNPMKYICYTCDYNTSNKKDFSKHMTTVKHNNNVNGNQPEIQEIPKLPSNETFYCNCHKTFKTNSGLWKHKQQCEFKNNVKQDDILMTLVSEIVKGNNEIKQQNFELQKQNTDLQKQILDICKNGIISINQVNSHNKTFNLNLFLHEDCKDAMNMSEFLESIKIQLADVMSVGELGYVDGISKLIIQNLNALDVTKRPVHCTDEKREVIYIKEAGVWSKDEDNSKLRRLIKTVSNRNFKHTRLYKEKYPDCRNPDSKYSDIYVKLVLEATGGGSKYNDYDSENKIMKKIAKVITIDKSTFS
jgi:hypothetical protein